ncbi:hypothetical protein B0H14DRAFT_2923104 [Mycena olivaceomarginata]|nr:hypothetical protein B0H14DRAFT_2923104 [Mycena olivaceomarginata]
MNPDMQGYIVRLSNFVTHIGVAMLIAWSTKSPRSYYQLLFAQIFFILIGVLISIRRNQISIDDAEFAVILTRSPICTYCVLFVLPRLFIKTLGGRLKNAVHNLKQLPTDPAVAWRELIIVLNYQAIGDGLCGGLILVLCLALDISVQLNGITRVYSSVQCGPGECWEAQGGRDAGTVRRWAALGVASLLIYESVLVRHQKLRWKLMHTLAARHPSIKHRFHWKRVIYGFSATWYIAVKLHPWIPVIYLVVLFEDWSRKLTLWTVEPDFEFSYGQFLALAPAVPVAWECVTLAISRRSQILQIPKLLLRDVVWIVSGRGESWKAEEELQLNDVWDAFPPDVLVVEPGLPTHARKPSATARNPRRRRRGAAPGPLILPEVDLGEVSLVDCMVFDR